MSELDLGSTAAPTPAVAPPAGPGTALVLAPPAPVQVIPAEQAAGAIPLDDAKKAELAAKAAAFADELAAMDVRSPAFAQRVGSITSMGDKDLRASANVSSRMLERPAAALNGPRAWWQRRADQGRREPWSDLRTARSPTWTRTAPISTGIKKVLKWIPGGDKVDSYFAKYQSAQSHLDAIVRALASGQGRAGQGQRQHRGREGQHVDVDGQAGGVQRACRRRWTQPSRRSPELEAAGPHRGRQHLARRRAVPDPAALGRTS
jgi:hypothetical protein